MYIVIGKFSKDFILCREKIAQTQQNTEKLIKIQANLPKNMHKFIKPLSNLLKRTQFYQTLQIFTKISQNFPIT